MITNDYILGNSFIVLFAKKHFATSFFLRTHERTHTGEKPFECEICNEKFSQQGNLKTHLRTHTGERPYSCNQCGKSFAQRANLNNHKCPAATVGSRTSSQGSGNDLNNMTGEMPHHTSSSSNTQSNPEYGSSPPPPQQPSSTLSSPPHQSQPQPHPHHTHSHQHGKDSPVNHATSHQKSSLKNHDCLPPQQHSGGMTSQDPHSRESQIHGVASSRVPPSAVSPPNISRDNGISSSGYPTSTLHPVPQSGKITIYGQEVSLCPPC